MIGSWAKARFIPISSPVRRIVTLKTLSILSPPLQLGYLSVSANEP
jgi:hypothetical protein